MVELLALAETARNKGMLALDEFETENYILKQGIRLLVDGIEIEEVKAIMQKNSDLMAKRYALSIKFFKSIATAALIMGVIGSIILGVQTLSFDAAVSTQEGIKQSAYLTGNLSSQIAVALIPILYGIIIAFVCAYPQANKLHQIWDGSLNARMLIIDVFGSISAGKNPKTIKEMLLGYLPGKNS